MSSHACLFCGQASTHRAMSPDGRYWIFTCPTHLSAATDQVLDVKKREAVVMPCD